MTVLLGAIADDFTGATDLANTLVKAGMRTILLTGTPEVNYDPGDTDAVVVALKSRTAPVKEAVDNSLLVLEWLLKIGVQQVFFKYCSTFDSTAKGNIGPVADALRNRLGDDIPIVCPAFPAAGRTIYKGNLFVGDVLLAESSMKDHPLTPMRDSSLVRLMSAQCAGDVGLVTNEVVSRGSESIKIRYSELLQCGMNYAVVDAIDDSDLIAIGESVAEHKLVTGGSGVAMGLPENYRRQGMLGNPVAAGYPDARGRSVVLSGSCSEATRKQIAFVNERWPSFKIDIDDIAAEHDVAGQAVQWYAEQTSDLPVLIYASEDPEEVVKNQNRYGRLKSGEMIENVFARIAKLLRDNEMRTLVVAGGETSGAVVSALELHSLRICAEIDPGVPWTETLEEDCMAIALKSGNFGGEDFFVKAVNLLGSL